MSIQRPRFSRAAVLAGVRQSLSLQVAIVPFALVCGIVAQGQGLSLLEATLMSAACYAGSAQLLALSHWAVPAPLLGATLATLVVNLRMALMGPVLGPWLDRLRGWRLWLSLFVMADQNWAMSVTEMQAGRWDAGYLFGSGAIMWVVWTLGTAAGHVMGASMRPVPGHPLFFAALAVFVAIVSAMWRGKRDLLPWLAAAAVSVLVSRLVDNTIYIVAGALAGATVGVFQDRRR
jgi:predicted branched-subunit amino acid permease